MEGTEIKSDVQEMNDAFESVIKEVEPTKEEEEVSETESESEEITAEEEGVESNEVDEEEVIEEEETTSEDKVDEKEETKEEDEKDKIIAELRKKLEEKESVEEEEVKEEVVEEPKFESQDFLDEDEDLEDLIRDPDKLNKVFNNIYQRAVTDTRKVLGEGILRSIPDIVRSSVDMMDRLKQMNTKFYTDNKDLEPFKKVVAAVFEEVATEHPGKDMMDILPMVADRSREKLELHKSATKTETRKSPRLPSRKRRTGIVEDKPNTNPLLNELEEMNKTLRR